MFGGILSAVGNAVTSGLNYNLQKQQFDYQKQLNQQMMQREDTAVQRRAADLEAAGLSKTLAAGGAASSQQLNAGSAPQIQPVDFSGMDQSAQQVMNLIKMRSDIAKTNAETTYINQQKAKSEVDQAYTEAQKAQFDYNYNWHKDRGLPTVGVLSGTPAHVYYGAKVAAYESTRAGELASQKMEQEAKRVQESYERDLEDKQQQAIKEKQKRLNQGVGY